MAFATTTMLELPVATSLDGADYTWVVQGGVDKRVALSLLFSTDGGHPAISTDNAIARYDGTAGVLQDSGVLIDDDENVSGVRSFWASATVSVTTTPITQTFQTTGRVRRLPTIDYPSAGSIVADIDPTDRSSLGSRPYAWIWSRLSSACSFVVVSTITRSFVSTSLAS